MFFGDFLIGTNYSPLQCTPHTYSSKKSIWLSSSKNRAIIKAVVNYCRYFLFISDWLAQSIDKVSDSLIDLLKSPFYENNGK